MEADSYEELGRKLRYLREERGLSLLQAATSLHIRPRYLEALEEGEITRLPGEPYVQGYYYHYARLLGLAPTQVVGAYQRLGTMPLRRLFHIPESMRGVQHPGPLLVLVTAISACVVIVMGSDMLHSQRQLLQPIQPPPVTQEASRMLTRECLNRQPGAPAWPPCFYHRSVLFSGYLPDAPVVTVMDLAQ